MFATIEYKPTSAARKSTLVRKQKGLLAILHEAGTSVGYEVETTTSAEYFLSKTREWLPTLIIMDLQMPEVDGVELLRQFAAAFVPAGAEKMHPPLVVQSSVPEQALPRAVAEAEAAIAAAAFRQAADSLRDLVANTTACALRVRAPANVEVAEAARVCVAALERHPLSVELHYLHAVLLIAQAQYDDAIRAAQRIVYFDGASEIGYLTLCVPQRARSAGRAAADVLVRSPTAGWPTSFYRSPRSLLNSRSKSRMAAHPLLGTMRRAPPR